VALDRSKRHPPSVARQATFLGETEPRAARPLGASATKYMVKGCGPPSPGWRTFLRNHAPDIAAMDLFVAPTIGFDLLYVLVIVRLERRNLVWINVTPHPTAEWIARQVRGIPLG
jgi:hypothetical protein